MPTEGTDLKLLTERMMAAPFVVIRHVNARDPDAIRRLLPDHFAYLIELERRGVLFGSGPVAGPDVPPYEGLTILQGVDLSGAQALWRDEPFFKAGLRDAHFANWTLNEGALRIRLSLSTATASLPGVRHERF